MERRKHFKVTGDGLDCDSEADYYYMHAHCFRKVSFFQCVLEGSLQAVTIVPD